MGRPMIADGRIKDIPAHIKQECEDRAIERAYNCNEDFLSHYFDVIMCLSCEHIEIASVMRSRRYIGDLQETITRRVCCGCGYNHKAHRTPVFRKLAR